jgi:Alr-MurF fusion protein
MLFFSQLSSICPGEVLQLHKDRSIEDLIIDSRKTLLSEQAIFFAIKGERHDGHRFIPELYEQGIRQFIVEESFSAIELPEANILRVKSSITALQQLAAFHRSQFSIPIIAITGSNGKTIIKEWLHQLLTPDYKIVKNPGSYNSQLGVPLSVWQMQQHHEMGIFEAGISKPDEMGLLQKIIQPTLGIFTNIGSAHDEGFHSMNHKLSEKLILFSDVEKLIYCSDQPLTHAAIQASAIPSLSWGFNEHADIRISQNGTVFTFDWKDQTNNLIIPFSDKASIENCFHCIALLLYLGYPPSIVQERISLLKTVPMRLELKQGINNCQVIDDSYNNDLGGLLIGLDFMRGIQKKKKTLILSDILQSGLSELELTRKISSMISKSDVTRVIAIGPFLFHHKEEFKLPRIEMVFYENTNAALQLIDWQTFQHEVILIKGARVFQFEKIVAQLQRKVHGTRMEIDLNKVVHNLNFFKTRLKPGVKLMVMVKAFAYGSGSEEIAALLQYHRVDYLGVAYADEGVELRKNQISIPIMVMNTSEDGFQKLLDYNLQPVMYSLSLLRSFIGFLNGKIATVHLEIETGMKRLGLEESDLAGAVELLRQHPQIKIASVFSHLAGADESQHDTYSKTQFQKFEKAYHHISSSLSIEPLRHILNSPGIIRMPDFQLDMVRLGIGLYGINPTAETVDQLLPAATLKTVISQIKNIKQGETVGYGRKGTAEKDITLATIAIGYADGFNRIFSRGVGAVLINGKKAPVVGNVCMDMTMVDITGIDAREGDDVIIFGDGLSIQEVAARAHTIPYEILTNTSERVKRIFYAESM